MDDLGGDGWILGVRTGGEGPASQLAPRVHHWDDGILESGLSVRLSAPGIADLTMLGRTRGEALPMRTRARKDNSL